MSTQRTLTHHIRIAAPAAFCQRLFTPAGEELWIDEWRPRYLQPADGRTQQGMVFTTGEGAEFTVWGLADWDPARHYARYSRVTPASRCAWVEVRCRALAAESTEVQVRYTLTALNDDGERWLQGFDEPAFTAMIDGWQQQIAARLPQLRAALA